MNNTTINKDALLEQLNNEKAVLMIPAFVYLVVLMLAGIIGNVLICYYYGFKSTRSSDNMFILGAAMYDLISCTLSIPIEIVDINIFYNFPYAGACKVMRFVTYFAAIGSVFTLIVIAIDRYRKICRPFKKQFRSKGAKIACGISIPFSLLLSWPAAVFYTSEPVEILTEDGIKLQGFDCTTTREASYKIYLLIFNGFFLCFLISAVILFVLYGLVGRAIYKHHKSQIQYTRPKLSQSNTAGCDGTDNNSPKENVNKIMTNHGTGGDMEAHSTGSEILSTVIPNKPKEHDSVKTMKFTTVMFVITIVIAFCHTYIYNRFDQKKSNDKYKYTVTESVESEADAANRRSAINMVAATNTNINGKSQNQNSYQVLYKMNNTTINMDAMLEQLNNEKAVLMIPAFIYLVVLMLAGISGNVLICYYYGFKSRRSSDNMFILSVAMYDLISCTLSIPIEIMDITLFYNFPYAGACKVMRFVIYFAAIGSVITLIVIAIDRYKKICRPFKKQFRSKEAKIACGISIPFSLLLAWPAAVFYTSVPVDVLTEDGIELQGFDCTTTREASYKIYLWIFNVLFLLAFIISAIILFVLYSLVGRAIYKHNKSQTKNTRPKSPCHHTVESHMTENNSPKVNVNKRKTNRETEGVIEAHSKGSEIHSKIVPNKSKEHVSVKTMKFTTVMFVITIVFIVSFLPHLALSLWRAFQGTYEGETLSGAGLVVFQIGLRSYLLNSAINPFIYGCFNSKFRAFIYMKFCRCCKG
ncbi:uncharacterized protein LOC123541372 [Mercenaria mercenaria]|uniref:uncharacterized protein LOC123541372 n=1 Tax=Mercenaria mercenaria TaxID=6596 RepID=UPI00234F68BB|nr:uncharacterized protein LOC123541372 [Mercenaria mercenaria]